MAKKPKITALKKQLDKIFGQYIKLRDADQNGMLRCITCSKLVHWKEAHCGHFVRRRHLAVRWDERNCHGQCCYCNTFLDGNEAEYFIALEDKLGREVVDELMQAKHQTVKLNRSFYDEMIEKYKTKIKIHGIPAN